MTEVSILEKNQSEVDQLIVKVYSTLRWVFLVYVLINVALKYKSGIGIIEMIFYGQTFLLWIVPTVFNFIEDKKKFRVVVILITFVICTSIYYSRGDMAILIWIVPIVLAGMYNDFKLSRNVVIYGILYIVVNIFVKGLIDVGGVESIALRETVLRSGKYGFQILAIGVICFFTSRKCNDLLDESEEMRGNIKKLLDNNIQASEELSSDIKGLDVSINEMESSSEEISKTFQNIVNKSLDIVVNIDHVNGNINETKNIIDKISNNMEHAIDKSNETKECSDKNKNILTGIVEDIEKSCEISDSTTAAMESLVIKSKEINEIIETIDNTAKKTNILTLNAAIESSRSGEAGKGLSVVADEMKKLSKESSESVNKIGEIFNNIIKHMDTLADGIKKNNNVVHENVNYIKESMNGFEEMFVIQKEIIETINDSSKLIEELFKSGETSKESVYKLREINNNNNDQISEIHALIEEMNANFNEVSKRSDNISKKSMELGTTQ